MTSDGSDTFVFPPSPTCAYLLYPQHLAPPQAVTHTECDQAEMSVIQEERPVTSTGTLLFGKLPFPSIPAFPLPQHFTPPDAISAQAP